MNSFFIPQQDWNLKNLHLLGEEFHHCIRVLRKSAGDQIRVFNGKGSWAICSISEIKSEILSLSIIDKGVQDIPNFCITLCQAIPKSSVIESLLPKCAELGVKEIQLLICQHSPLSLKMAEKKLEKWKKILLMACKQSGQFHLPNLLPILDFSEWIKYFHSDGLKVLGSLEKDSSSLHSIIEKKIKSAHLLIGPEGDFAEEEFSSSLKAGFLPVSFGSLIMRVETAAIYGLSILNYEMQNKD